MKKYKKIGGIPIDVNETVNQAIRYVKSNPCAVCSCESFCNIRYKGTCHILRKLRIAFYSVAEVENE